jgi:hypothetical protein
MDKCAAGIVGTYSARVVDVGTQYLGPEVLMTPGPHLGGRSEVLRATKRAAKTTLIIDAIAVPMVVQSQNIFTQASQLYVENGEQC